MSIAIYANGQLGQERDLLELLQIGSLDMTKVSAGVIEHACSNRSFWKKLAANQKRTQNIFIKLLISLEL